MTFVKLLHLANHNSTNIGNGALIHGTERALREDLGGVSFVAEPWDEYTLTGTRRFDETFVARVNACDGLLVNGAVTLNGRPMFTHAGMRLDLPFHLWSQIDRPIVFAGISYRVWPGQKYHHVDALRKTVEHLTSQPRVLFGVRNDGTKRWLESLIGFSSDAIVEVPDPALYVPAAKNRPPSMPTKPTIVVSLNNEDDVYRFGGGIRERVWPAMSGRVDERRLARWWGHMPGWRSRRRRMLQQLADALDLISRERDLGIVLCPHYFDDYTIMSELVGLCSPRLAHQVMTSTGLAKVDQSDAFYAWYAHADLAISMRVHSISPSLGLGTPVLALSTQGRITDFMRDAGLADFTVDAFDDRLAETLIDKIRFCLDHGGEVRQRLADARARLRARTAAFNRRVGALVEPATATSAGSERYA